MVYTKQIRQCLNCETNNNILDIISKDKENWKKGFNKYHSLSKNEITQKLNELNAISDENDDILPETKIKGKTDIRQGKSIDEYTILNIIKYLETDTGKTFKTADPITKKLFEYDPYETAYDKNKDKYRDYQRKIIKAWTLSAQELLILYYGVGTGKTLIATTMAEEFTRIMYDAYVYFILPASLVFNTIGLMFKYGIDPTIKDKDGNYIYNFLSYQQIVKTKYNFKPNSLLIIDEVHNLRNLISKPELIKKGFKSIPTGDYKLEGSILTEQLLYHTNQIKRKVFMTGTLFVNSPLDIEPIIALGYNRPPLIEYRQDLYDEIIEDDERFKHYYQGLISFYRIEGENLKLMPTVKYNFVPIFTEEKEKNTNVGKDTFLLETRLLGTKDKINWTIKFLKMNINKKTLIYAQFLDKQISLLIDEMKKDKSFKFGLISGQLSPKQKQVFIDAYNTNKINILIFSLAIKEGISFKETDNFIVFTPYWNYAITEQVIARAIRLDSHKEGDKSLVNVYFPFMNSLETDLTEEEMDKAIVPFVKKAEDLMNNIGIKKFSFPLKKEKLGNDADIYFNIPLDLKRQRDLDMYYRMFNKMNEINKFEKRLLQLPKFEDVNNSENNDFIKTINKELLNLKDKISKKKLLTTKKRVYTQLFDEQNKKNKRIYPQLTPEDYINKYFVIQEDNQTNLTDEEIDKIIEDYFNNNTDNLKIDILLNRLGINREEIVKFQAFFTPQNIAEQLIKYSGLLEDPRGNNIDNDEDYLRILEGTAGIGNIIAPLQDENFIEKNMYIDANEYNKIFYKIGKYVNPNVNTTWTNLDFMKFISHYNYDYILGNPPFSLKTKAGQLDDIDFLAHAYDLLNENGTLAYIVSNKFTFRTQKKFIQFRKILEELKSKDKKNVSIYNLEGGFKKDKFVTQTMETNVSMVYIIIKKVDGISFIINEKEKIKADKKNKIIVELPKEPIPEPIIEPIPEPIIEPIKIEEPIKKKRGRPPKVKPEEPIKIKECPKGKILNPKTNRCIKDKNINDYEIPKTLNDAIKKINSIIKNEIDKLNLIYIIIYLYHILDNKNKIKKEILSFYNDVNKEIIDYNEKLLDLKPSEIIKRRKKIMKRTDFIKLIDYFVYYKVKQEINGIFEAPEYTLQILKSNSTDNIKYFYININKDSDKYLNNILYTSLIFEIIKKYLDKRQNIEKDIKKLNKEFISIPPEPIKEEPIIKEPIKEEPIIKEPIKEEEPILKKIEAIKKAKKALFPFINRVSADMYNRNKYYILIKRELKLLNTDKPCLKVYKKNNNNIEYQIGDKIILKKRIGSESAFGQVYLSEFIEENKKLLFTFASKIYKYEDRINKSKNELEILNKLSNYARMDLCPHYPLFYGYLRCDNFLSGSNIILKDYPKIIKKNANEKLMTTFTELANGDGLSFINLYNNNDNLIINAYIQQIMSILFFNYHLNRIHKDTHLGNFLFHKIEKGGYFHYDIFGEDYYLENLGFLWVIWDFDFSFNIDDAIKLTKFKGYNPLILYDYNTLNESYLSNENDNLLKTNILLNRFIFKLRLILERNKPSIIKTGSKKEINLIKNQLKEIHFIIPETINYLFPNIFIKNLPIGANIINKKPYKIEKKEFYK